jgi:ribonuclease BN (tRNA processing enzyme)
VEEAGSCVLLDCGSGVFAQLRRVRDYVDVDAIVVSHMHADHFLDLIPYAHALTYAPRQQPEPIAGWPGTDRPARPRLFVPPGAIELMRLLSEAGGQPRIFDKAFELAEYEISGTLELGCLRARFQPVPHYVPTNAIELTPAHGGGRFVYGADHGPTDVLREFAAGAELLMLEATLPFPEAGAERGHMTAAEAGEHAAGCGAQRLLLTHITDELDHEHALAEARRAYSGPVEITQAGAVYEV